MKARKILQGKIRGLLCVAMVVVLIAVIAGCGATEKDYLEKPGRIDQYIHSHPVGTTVRYDLNGDGTGEISRSIPMNVKREN